MTKQEAAEKAMKALDKALKSHDGAKEACEELEGAIRALTSTGANDETEAVCAEWASFVKRIKKALKTFED